MNENWSDHEVELIVADYFSMLVDELKGIDINKTRHRNLILPLLNKRSTKSVEFKHRNISAVLIELGQPFIKGYKPAANAQRSKLVPIIQNYLHVHQNIEHVFFDFATQNVLEAPKIEFERWLVSPPVNKGAVEKQIKDRRPIKINYLEKEQNNRALGLKGEELAIAYEKFNLMAAGKESLADQIEWISKDIGDGSGFDILSKNLNGTDKYIEVKTTKLSKETPFFFSLNEYNFSIENERDYHLYRIFNFNENSRMFALNGRFDKFCQMEAIQYRGRI
jgi:hypothetical protein